MMMKPKLCVGCHPSLSYQICPSSVRGLLALCALGMVQMDLDLIEATLKELSDLVQGGESLVDVATLKVAFKVGQVNEILVVVEWFYKVGA